MITADKTCIEIGCDRFVRKHYTGDHGPCIDGVCASMCCNGSHAVTKRNVSYNTWIDRLNAIASTPATSNGYVNAGQDDNCYWIDNNGTIERFEK